MGLALTNSIVNQSDLPLSVKPEVHTADWAVKWWLPRHKQKLLEKSQMEKVDLVFLGDSITHAWEYENVGLSVWQKRYEPLHALNLGFSGDRTEHVLWRLENGAVDNISPKLLVLMIGTNNTGHRQDKPADTALGIKTIIDALKSKLPSTKILLLGIFPRGATADDPLRMINDEVNKLMSTFDDGEHIQYLNINHVFLDEQKQLSTTVMGDLLHPNKEQYLVWADAIEPYITPLLLKQ